MYNTIYGPESGQSCASWIKIKRNGVAAKQTLKHKKKQRKRKREK